MSRRRWARRLSLALLAVLSLAGLGIVGAGSSTSVLRWLLGEVDAQVSVSFEGIEGSLLGGLQVERISGSLSDVAFAVEEFSLQVDWRCLPRSQVCLDLVEARSVRVELPNTQQDEEASPEDVASFWPPDAVLRMGAVQSLAIVRGDVSEQFDGLSLTAEAEESGLSLTHFSGTHRFGSWETAGHYDRRGAWHAEMAWESTRALVEVLGEGLPTTFTLGAEGDRQSLSGSLLSPERDDLGIDLQLTGLATEPTWTAQIRHGSLLALYSTESVRKWIQPLGALSVAGSSNGNTLSARIEQELTGFPDGRKTFAANLRLVDGHLLIDDARLGDGEEVVLDLHGALGPLDALTPSLSITLDDFHAPVAANLPISGISGLVDLSIDLADATYSLETDELLLEQGTRRFGVRGRLEGAEDALLPHGELRLTAAGDGDGESPGPLELHYRRADREESATVTLAGGLGVGDLTLDSLALKVTSGPERQIDATIRGDVDGDVRLLVRPFSDGLTLELAPTTLDVLGESLLVPQVVGARWIAESGLVALDAACLAWRNSRLCTEPAILGSSGELSASLVVDEAYDGDWADKPFRMAGRGNGEATVRWADGDLITAEFALVLDALELDPLVAAGTAGPLSWERVEVRGGVDDTLGLEAHLHSELLGNLDLSLGENDGVLSGNLKADALAVQPWTDLIPELGVRGGTGTAALSIGGTLDSPQLHGQVTLEELAATIEEVGTNLDNGRLRFELAGQNLSFSGDGLLGGGRLELNGHCCEKQRLLAQVVGTGNTIGLSSGLSARLSPDVDLTVSPDSLGLQGQLTVHEGVFEHRSPRDEGVAISSDIQRVDALASGPRRFAFDADLRTIIEPRFTLRSKEIESTLAGDLRVLVNDRQPVEVYGDLRVLGGELRALGQVLRVSEGVVGFVGDPMNPNLNLSAEREIRAESLRVGFKVQGNLETPDLTLFSDPPRSERDTLSFLIRGRGPDAGATVDSTAMALSLGATAVNRSGVLRSLESIPGLSDVSIGTEGSDDELAATISAYVGRRLFLSYGVGLYEPVNALTARLYLRSRLWLEVVSRLESSFDLYYRFERN